MTETPPVVPSRQEHVEKLSMATPVEVLADYKALLKGDELTTAARQLVEAHARIHQAVVANARLLSRLAVKYGQQNLLDALPEEVRTALTTSLQSLQQVYAAISPDVFPEIPDQPKGE